MKRILFLVVLLLVCVPIAYYYNTKPIKKKLPIISPCDLLQDVVAPEIRNKCRDHRIKDFEFYNQNGNYIKSCEIIGGIWVVEYFFATCMGICPTMNSQLKRVQSDGFASSYIQESANGLFRVILESYKNKDDALTKINDLKASGKSVWLLE